MKKTLLTLGAALLTTGAFAQGSLNMQSDSTAGGVSIDASSPSTSAWYSGTLTLEVFAIQNASLTAYQSDATTINADWQNPALALSTLEADGWVQQTIDGGESISAPTTDGGFNIGIHTIGNSTSLAGSGATVNTIYAIYGVAGSDAGVLVFNPSTTGAPSPGTPVNFSTAWPGQNLALVAAPEPTTLALAALGGLSMLGLRRRKA